MKVLYVKNGSERDKKFQLQTMIYEEHGKKFVKKSVLCDEALPHLHKMLENYTQLSNSIINPNVRLAKIINQDKRSLTFEYIEGISLLKQFNQIANNKDSVDTFIKEYIDLLNNSFKTTTFDSKNVSKELQEVFGNFDYSVLDGEVCFDGISNIDLIFSNIIYKDDEIYIIDYEWVFEWNIPITYITYRTLLDNNISKFNELFKSMELCFIEKYVCNISFKKYSVNYYKSRFSVEQKIESKEKELKHMNKILNELWKRVEISEKNSEEKDITLKGLWKRVEISEKNFEELKSKSIKNRIKRVLGHD